MVKRQSLFSNIARVLSANFWVAIVGFVGSFIFPKILSIEAYALYHTFTLYVGYVGIMHLGFPSGMVINYAGKSYESMDKQQYKTELFILFGILSLFTIGFGIFGISTQNMMACYVALSIIPVCYIASYRSLCQSWSEFKLFTRLNTFTATVIPIIALGYYLIRKDLPGEIYIAVYLIVYWFLTVVLMKRDILFTKGAKANKIFTTLNWNTEKTGLALMIGNYMSVLFTSADRQFIKIFFETTEFAFYSFGMSMQSLMTVFITSIAQPLFPAMAQGRFSDEEYNEIKDLLLVFGSLSGCAYFAASFVVNHFIQKYIGSLKIVGIYFAVFPALAVINCLFINLYKIKNQMKKYILTIASVLLIAIGLNMLFIKIMADFSGVAIATTITYYIWLIIGLVQFPFIKMKIRDVVFLLYYFVLFFTTTRLCTDILGFFIYFALISIAAYTAYKGVIKKYVLKKAIRS